MRISDWSSDVCSSDLVFMLIPVMAPTFGQAILWIAPWRWIFWALAILATLILLWMGMRLPETLLPENRLRMSAGTIFRTVGTIVRTRTSIGYMLASGVRSEEHTSELQSLMRISYAVFCLKKKKT